MKKIFRKAMTIAGSAALIGMTIGAAAAAAYPSPFTSANTAIVVGANAAPSDTQNGANLIAANLDAAAGTTTTLTGGEGVTEEEVALGGYINTTTASAASKISATLTDSKIPSLLDTKINWDDGGASGADDYNIHEEILVGDMSIKTTFNDNDFEELLAMTQDKALQYRYVFDDALNVTGVGATDADDFYLTILGKQYEISAMTTTSITVITSEEVVMSKGDSVTVEGKVFTLEDLSSTAARVNGETVTTSPKKINGLKVEVKTGSIFYNENFPEDATVTLKIGSDISKTYTAGEEYIGEDENDPNWVWTFSDPSTAGGYIGVQYNQKETRDTDDVVYEGGSYLLPENFGAVTFDGTTDVTYEDFKVYFDDAEDLWNSTDLTSTAQVQDAPVLIIESVDGVKDSILLSDNNETSRIYLKWADNDEEIQGTQANATLEVYFSDVNGQIQDAIKPRFSVAYPTPNASVQTIGASDIGDLVVGDTTIGISAVVTTGNLQIIFTDGGAGQNFTVDVGGVALSQTDGELKWFGGDTEATDKGDGLAGDLLVAGTQVGTYDNDIMTYNGQIIKTPESNLDNDEVIFSVPSDRVYAIVSVVAGGEATSDGEAGALVVRDTEVASVAGKNLIVVGGSAINSVAAELLGGQLSEGAFTAATGVGDGEFLIQSFPRSGKVALLVAGYNAPDTEKAVTVLLNENIDTSVGKKYKGTSATEAVTEITAA